MEITIGILSWRSHLTLINTLDSFKNGGLLDLTKVVIYFQEISDKDIEIATRYGVKYFGSTVNTGIIGGFYELLVRCETKYFIFCENDFELVHDKDETSAVLRDCQNLLDNYQVDKINLRDRKQYGEPLFSKPKEEIGTFRLGMGYPYKIESLYFVDKPEDMFPGVFNIVNLDYQWYICDSVHQKWSNNVFISKTDWLKSKLLSLIQTNLTNKSSFMMEELIISSLKDYKICSGIGLFKHNRLDR